MSFMTYRLLGLKCLPGTNPFAEMQHAPFNDPHFHLFWFNLTPVCLFWVHKIPNKAEHPNICFAANLKRNAKTSVLHLPRILNDFPRCISRTTKSCSGTPGFIASITTRLQTSFRYLQEVHACFLLRYSNSPRCSLLRIIHFDRSSLAQLWLTQADWGATPVIWSAGWERQRHCAVTNARPRRGVRRTNSERKGRLNVLGFLWPTVGERCDDPPAPHAPLRVSRCLALLPPFANGCHVPPEGNRSAPGRGSHIRGKEPQGIGICWPSSQNRAYGIPWLVWGGGRGRGWRRGVGVGGLART